MEERIPVFKVQTCESRSSLRELSVKFHSVKTCRLAGNFISHRTAEQKEIWLSTAVRKSLFAGISIDPASKLPPGSAETRSGLTFERLSTAPAVL